MKQTIAKLHLQTQQDKEEKDSLLDAFKRVILAKESK